MTTNFERFLNNNETVSGLVSVVIPTHNRADMVIKAVESAIAQTYSQIEIIVTSDGYDCATDSVMKTVCEKYDNVFYYTYPEAKGANFARNNGIAHARGEFIAFLDDDDQWQNFKIEKQVGVFSADPQIGIVCCAIQSTHTDLGRVVNYVPDAQYDSSNLILLKNCVGSTTTVMVRRNVLEKSGIFDENLTAAQDYDLWIRVCQCTKVGVVREACVAYNNAQTNNQISHHTDRYEKSLAYIEEKYKDLYLNLSESEKKQQKVNYLLILAGKAILNGDRVSGRKFVRKAQNVKWTKQAFIYWCSSFFSYNFILKVQALLRK